MPFQNIPQTSFIPKKPLTNVGRPKVTTGVSFFLIVVAVLFIASLGWSAYSFFARKAMEKGITDAEETISKNEKFFDVSLLDSVTRISNKLKVARELLDEHLDSTKIFDVISAVTITNVRYTNFSYSIAENGDIKIAMNGEAESYYAVAKQADVYASASDLKNPVMSSFSVADDGTVAFSFASEVPRKLLMYKQPQ